MADDAGAGAEGVVEGADGAEGSGLGEVITPEAANWWMFSSKEDATTWGNKLVQDRLTRERRTKLDPVTTERDTLKAEVERLRPLEDATKTDIQRRDDQLTTQESELSELRAFKAQADRGNLVRSIAEEAGLDPKFVKFIDADDEDGIREKVSELLNVLSEGGSTPPAKKTPKSKAPKADDDTSGGSLSGGGGGSDDDTDDTLSASILEQIKKDRLNGGLHARR